MDPYTITRHGPAGAITIRPYAVEPGEDVLRVVVHPEESGVDYVLVTSIGDVVTPDIDHRWYSAGDHRDLPARVGIAWSFWALMIMEISSDRRSELPLRAGPPGLPRPRLGSERHQARPARPHRPLVRSR